MTARDPYRDPEAIAGLIRRIGAAADQLDRGVTFMEVCGTHTHSVAAAGLRRMLPGRVRLISGPGCPVCVTPVDYLDRALALAERPATEVCTFGDLMRVPSSHSSLERARAEGARIEVVYSARDAIERAARNPSTTVIFLAVGFETTAPTIAAALAEADARGIANFLILPGNKVMPPPMEALVSDPELQVDGFLLPGHVSVLTGWKVFRFLAEDHGVPGAVVGFAPSDVLQGVLELMQQSISGSAQITNLYDRAVDPVGNRIAAALIDRYFVPTTVVWRGFGPIPGSGLGLKPEHEARDASLIPVDVCSPVEPAGCRCGEVLRGSIDPPECPLYGSGCTPDLPIGACMVSAEGTCAAWYRHGLGADA